MIERRTILIPIDAHGVDRPSLETLVGIARELDRGLLALVLENTRLRQVAQLPFTTEVVLAGAGERNLLPEDVGAQSSGTRYIRQTLADLAKQSRVSVDFESAAGEMLDTAMLREGRSDIFLPQRQRLGALATRYAPHRVPRRSLGLVLTGSADDASVVATACAVLSLNGEHDVYLLCTDQPAPMHLDMLSRGNTRLCVRRNFKATADNICDLIRQPGYSVKVLPRSALANVPPEKLTPAIEAARGQILLVS